MAEGTAPVPLSIWMPRPRTPILEPDPDGGLPRVLSVSDPDRLPVRVLSLSGEWIGGSVVYWSTDPVGGLVALEVNVPLQGGMSGGPVIDAGGRLVGSEGTRGVCRHAW